MTDIGVLGAFLGGLLVLLSPCSALLLPAFFAYAFDNLGRLAARTTVFYLGLATVMVPLGAGAGAFSSLVTQYRSTATLIGAVLLIGFGVVIALGRGFTLGFAQRRTASLPISGYFSVYLLGTVYALAGFCAGPLVGAVLTLALVGGDPGYGAVIGGVFALGMAVPLFVLALLWDRLQLSKRRWLRGREISIGPVRTHTTSLLSGLLFVVIGTVLLLTDGTANLGGLLDVDADQRLQERIRSISAAIPDGTVLFAVLVLAVVVMARRVLRRRGA